MGDVLLFRSSRIYSFWLHIHECVHAAGFVCVCVRVCCLQDDFEGSDGSTEDEIGEVIYGGDRARRESALSIGESSVHSSLFGGK